MIKKFCLTLAVISAATLSIVSAQQTAKVTASGIGYLEYLPQGYNSNSDKYPIVISLHGIREKGASTKDRNRIISDLQKVDNVGLPKYVKQGKKYPFILISPQLQNKLGSWPSWYVIDVLKHVKKYLRIDDRRIYLTGLSLGGLGVWRTAGDYPDVFAAIGPICPGGNSITKANDLARENVAAWGFHGSSDKIVSYKVTTKMISAMNAAPKKPTPLAKATIFAGAGHVIWDQAYNSTNLLDWMLSHKKGSSGGWSDNDDDDDDDDNNHGDNDDDDDNDGKDDDDNESKSNKQPVVKAGSDKTITLPTDALYLEGNANDPDGKITAYQWTKISGGSASMKGTNSSKLRAYNLKEGTYVFRLTAKDNKGAVRSDEVSVTVRAGAKQPKEEEKEKVVEEKKPSKNMLPIVTAGPDRVITLPTNTIDIQAHASDKDGKITSYEWTQTYGLSKASVSGANAQTMRAYNLKKGAYIFRLRVTDNDGGTKDDYFKITVKKGSQQNNSGNNKPSGNDKPSGNNNSTANSKPRANAGPDVTVRGETTVTLNGSGVDSDGRIVSYQWKQLAGPNINVSQANSQQPTLSNLKEGRYYFSLTVKDDKNATHTDKMAVRVRRK